MDLDGIDNFLEEEAPEERQYQAESEDGLHNPDECLNEDIHCVKLVNEAIAFGE